MADQLDENVSSRLMCFLEAAGSVRFQPVSTAIGSVFQSRVGGGRFLNLAGAGLGRGRRMALARPGMALAGPWS